MEALGIDYKLLIAQIINFVLFFLIFKKFLAKPLFDYLTKQKKQEKEKEQILEDLKKKEEKIKKEEEEVLKNIQNQSNLLLAEAKKEAVKTKEELLKQGQEEIKYLKIKEQKQLIEERDLIRQDMKNQIIKTSELIVRKILKEFINEKNQDEITNNILQKLKNMPLDDKNYYEN